MRQLFTILAVFCLLSAPANAQTVKSVMLDTNGIQVNPFGSGGPTNPSIRLGTNNFGFSRATGPDRIFVVVNGVNSAIFSANTVTATTLSGNLSGGVTIGSGQSISFSGGANVAGSRTNLGLGATWLTNTNVTNFRTDIGLGATNDVNLASVGTAGGFRMDFANGSVYDSTPESTVFAFNGVWHVPISFIANSVAATTRTNLQLGATDIVTFAGLTNNGDITINQTTPTNGLLYIRRTNNEPFLGLANLIASNNTTVSNETLFRVGVAEATNRAAQFGFRSTNANGNGVAVFSVFGYNALMMIGVNSSSNAVISSGGGTNNEVMTLIKNGSTEFARPISFSSEAHAVTTRSNILPAYRTFTFTTNTNNVVTTNTNLLSGKVLAVNSNATDVEWVNASVATNSFTNSAAFVLRTNSTSRSSTTTTADEVLTYSFPSSGKYFVTLGHLMTVDTNSGLKARIIATNATVYGTWSFSASVLTNDYNYALGSTSGDRMFHQWFIVDANTNSSVALGWGQVSGTNTTTINAGSFMRIEKFE